MIEKPSLLVKRREKREREKNCVIKITHTHTHTRNFKNEFLQKQTRFESPVAEHTRARTRNETDSIANHTRIREKERKKKRRHVRETIVYYHGGNRRKF
jgi:hypothetical protein